MKLTWNSKIVLRPDKKKANGEIPIYYSIRVGPSTNRLPTGKFILLKDWNTKAGCPKSNTPLNQLLAAYLTGKLAQWNTYMLEAQTLGKPITLTMACAFFQENTKVTFYQFFQSQIELWEVDKVENTLKTYRSTLNVLKKFAPKANFGDLTYEFVQKFDLHLSKSRGNSIGGKFGRHKTLKAIINEAIKKGYLTMEQNPYRFFKIKAAAGKREFLSVEEIKELINIDIPESNTFLHKVRDLFLFSCFTGLRYSDVMNLRWADVKDHYITVEMTKTKKQVMIPLVPAAKAILEKYGKHCIKSPQGRALPQMTNQVLNRELKVLMDKSTIKKPITFHCSRHTFASTLIQAKTNILYVKDLLGHSKITETQIYAKSLQADLYTSMDNLASLYEKVG